jgi:hypothetical protein
LLEVIVDGSMIALDVNEPSLMVGAMTAIQRPKPLNEMDRRVEGYHGGPASMLFAIE